MHGDLALADQHVISTVAANSRLEDPRPITPLFLFLFLNPTRQERRVRIPPPPLALALLLNLGLVDDPVLAELAVDRNDLWQLGEGDEHPLEVAKVVEAGLDCLDDLVGGARGGVLF